MRRRFAGLVTATVVVTGLAVGAPGDAGAQEAPPAAEPASVPGEVIVGYRDGEAANAKGRARAAVAAREARPIVTGPGRGEVETLVLASGADKAAAIRKLERDPAVAFAEPNWIYRAQGKPSGGVVTDDTTPATGPVVNDPFYTKANGYDLWGMYGPRTTPTNTYGSNVAPAWTAGHKGGTVFVGVIDEGIQITHPDLKDNVGVVDPVGDADSNGNPDDDGNGYVDDTHGWNFITNSRNVFDGAGDDHGTHVAGTIGAQDNNDMGVVGVAPDVKLLSAKFLGANGGTTDTAVKAVDYFTGLKQRGVNIVATNNSWGGGGYSTALHGAINRAAKAGILFVAAAGNNGRNNDSFASYPSNYDTRNAAGGEPGATYDAVLAVAAIDSAGRKASFSNYGRRTVDLGAPGVAVWSTVPGPTAADDSTTANVNEEFGYGRYDGTSMATPHVTGAVALLGAKGLSPSAIRDALMTKGTATSSLSKKTVSGKRLNVAASLGL